MKKKGVASHNKAQTQREQKREEKHNFEILYEWDSSRSLFALLASLTNFPACLTHIVTIQISMF